VTEMMKVAVYYNNRDVRLEERPVPPIGPGELLVRIEACGLCGGDTMEWYLVRKAPVILGHEPTGTVYKVGKGVEKFKEGDRVYVHHHVGCMACHYCRRGDFTMCEHFRQVNIEPNAFAEYVRVPAELVRLETHTLPDNVSFEEGTLIEPLACVLKGIKVAGIQPGDTVAVIGAGLMGLGFIQFARMWGAARIIAFDFSDWRLRKARKLGANHTINPSVEDGKARLLELNEGRGADSVIVTPHELAPVEFGLSLAGKGATVHMFAPPPPGAELKLDLNDTFFRQLTLTTTYSTTHIETRQVLDFLANGCIAAQELVTHRFGLDRVADAIQLLQQAGESLKIVIVPALADPEFSDTHGAHREG
jgi:L-iditol 2-dehydrogenase